MELVKKCNIFGVDDTSEPHVLVKKALDASVSLLDIFKFIEITGFELDPIMTNWFWQIMVNDHSSHLTRVVLEWFGYEGEYYNQKQLFCRMLKRNNIPFSELKHTDSDIVLYPSIKKEMDLLPHKAAVTSSKWLVMKPYDIKMAMLRLNTKNADIIKRYYIKMEELVRMYAQYTTLLQKREKEVMSREMVDLRMMMEDMKLENKKQTCVMTRQEEERRQDRLMLSESHNMLRSMGIDMKDLKYQNTNLLEQNNDLLDQNNELIENVEDIKQEVDLVKVKLGISVEDRAPQPDKNRRKERFLFLKRDNVSFPYYTIRAQDVNAKKALKRQQDMYPSTGGAIGVVILLDLLCHPNTKTFYVRIKDDLRKRGVEFNLCEISIANSDITEEMLIEAMMKINDDKRNV